MTKLKNIELQRNLVLVSKVALLDYNHAIIYSILLPNRWLEDVVSFHYLNNLSVRYNLALCMTKLRNNTELQRNLGLVCLGGGTLGDNNHMQSCVQKS
jgi:hypothetical protein